MMCRCLLPCLATPSSPCTRPFGHQKSRLEISKTELHKFRARICITLHKLRIATRSQLRSTSRMQSSDYLICLAQRPSVAPHHRHRRLSHMVRESRVCVTVLFLALWHCCIIQCITRNLDFEFSFQGLHRDFSASSSSRHSTLSWICSSLPPLVSQAAAPSVHLERFTEPTRPLSPPLTERHDDDDLDVDRQSADDRRHSDQCELHSLYLFTHCTRNSWRMRVTHPNYSQRDPRDSRLRTFSQLQVAIL